MKSRNIVLAATMLAVPLAAQAQPLQGLYLGLGGGMNVMQQESVRSINGVALDRTHLHTHLGGVGAISGGWGFGNGLRTELEFDYRYNGLDTVTTPAGSGSVKGSEQKFGPMVNVLYDINLSPLALTPYVGAGAGYQWAREHTSVAGASGTETKGNFAVQGIAGLGMPIPEVPGLAATAEYRFMALPGDRNYSGLKLNDDYNHSLLVGLRYAFNAVTATPAAAPAPATVAPAPVSRSYLVFFDWDKAVLSDRARQIIAEAAANSTKVQYTQLAVNGYTDTSGTPKYNQGLSVRRAQAVAAELVKHGVPKGAITIQGFGETRLLVPTGANVREPQNRRVEIIIR